MRVWLVRFVCVPGAGRGDFARAVELPFTPFPGLELQIKPNNDPPIVKYVQINQRGAVLAYLEPADYDEDTFSEDIDPAVMAREQFEWETHGWRCLDGSSAYRLDPPGDADLTPLSLRPPEPGARPAAE